MASGLGAGFVFKTIKEKTQRERQMVDRAKQQDTIMAFSSEKKKS